MTDRAASQVNEKLQLISMMANLSSGKMPSAEIVLTVDGVEKTGRGEGDGVVDASYKAVQNVFPSDSELVLYSVNNITSGTDSQGEVSVRLQREGRIVNGHGADTDIVVASVKAYVNALNRLEGNYNQVHPQLSGTG